MSRLGPARRRRTACGDDPAWERAHHLLVEHDMGSPGGPTIPVLSYGRLIAQGRPGHQKNRRSSPHLGTDWQT
jgi:hypothetical protein